MKTIHKVLAGSVLVLIVLLSGPGGVFADAYWVFFQPETGWRPGDPVPEKVVRSVRESGARIRTVSRYFYAVSVDFDGNASLLEQIGGAVKVQPVGKLARIPDPGVVKPGRVSAVHREQGDHLLDYGISYIPLEMLKIPELHDRGLTGKGVVIGVIDAGFNTQNTGCLKNLNIAATKNFITGGTDVKGYYHGTAVLGCLGGQYEKIYYGAAFGATFLLALTEYPSTETRAEEDRWVAGVEWCDSLGADIISSSVVYAVFDSPDVSYSKNDMDGKTTLCARAAEIAFSHGILVVCGAGNWGMQKWRIVLSPADAEHVIAAGAVQYITDSEPLIWPQSSRGPTADGRIKPDLVACGAGIYYPEPGEDDIFKTSSGTSFSTPFISGLCALLLEAHPDWTPANIIEALKATAHDLGVPGPDNDYGWGMPDGIAAVDYNPTSRTPDEPVSYPLSILCNHPNPFNLSTTISFTLPEPGTATLAVYDITGRKVRQLVSGHLTAGSHAAVWDGCDSSGRLVSSGIYLTRLVRGSLSASHRMMLVK